MTDEMLSFLAGGSTLGLVKPVTYDKMEVYQPWVNPTEFIFMS